MLPDPDLLEVVNSNIKKFRTGGFIINYDRAEKLSKDHPNKRNILSELYDRIRSYERSKLGPGIGLPDALSLQFCSELFDEAFLFGVLVHKDHTEPKDISKEKNESIAGKDQGIVNPADDFDAFVSYSRGTGGHHAEIIKRNLEGFRVRTFVDHIEQPNYSGDFREKVDNVISNCRYFILLINIDTYERGEVIREVKESYPKGKTQRPKLVIFRQAIVERTSEEFVTRTGIDISTENQHDFNNDEELATNVIRLCKAKDIVKVGMEQIQPVVQNLASGSTPANQRMCSNKASVEEFKRKIAKYNFWKYFQVKTFLYRTPNSRTWKAQFIFIELLGAKPDTLTGTNTEHLRLIHTVQEIDRLYDLLDEIAIGKNITIEDTLGSLELMQNKIKEGSYYRKHPQAEIFAIQDASLGLVKPGDTSAELFDNDRLLLRELEDRFDNLTDAVANILKVSFWDGSYSPFVAVFATFSIDIIDSEITNASISLKLNCSSLLNLDGMKLKLQNKDSKGRQIGEAQTFTGFRPLTETDAVLNTNLDGNDEAEFLTIKLYYYDALIQERSYSRNQTGTRWYPIN